MSPNIMVQTSPPLAGLVDEERMKAAAAHVLATESPKKPAALTLVLVDDGEIRKLNLTYRNIDAPTDVLSFPAGALPPGEAGREMRGYLGDVIISYPRVVVQSAQRMVSPEQELDRLVVHGALHLLGYEDKSDAGRETMWKRQESLCEKLVERYDSP